MPGKRRFGRVRQLPSGRWQARYKGPDGIDRPAPRTFESKTSAERWLSVTEAEIIQDGWIDPDGGRVLFAAYARDWIEERPELRPKTVELYRYLLRQHLEPALGARALADIKEPHVRRWRKNLLDSGVSAVTAAKAYRLLKAVFNTAVDDGLIRRNPCRIKGAGQEVSPERPVLTVAQVYAVADAVDQRYRALVLLAVFSSLRWGELAALRRCDIDVQTRTVRIMRQLTEHRGDGLVFGPPKSEAGRRTVAIPELIMPDVAVHLVTYAHPGDDGFCSRALGARCCATAIFTVGSGGQRLRRPGFPRCTSMICATQEISWPPMRAPVCGS
jgi:integrase